MKDFAKKIFVATLIVLGVAAFVALFLEIHPIFFIAFGGLLFGILVSDWADHLQKQTHLRKNINVGIIWLSVLLFFTLIGFLIGPQIIEQIPNLFREELPRATENLIKKLSESAFLNNFIENIDIEYQRYFQTLLGYASNFFTLVANILVLFVLTFFISFETKRIKDGFLDMIPNKQTRKFTLYLEKLHKEVTLWIRDRVISMLIIGVMTTIGLLILGTPLAIALGIIAALLSFIPFIGPVLSYLPAALLAFSQSPQDLLYVTLLYGIVQILETNIITPLIHRQSLKLPFIVIILGELIFGALFGMLGFIFAIPAIIIINISIQRFWKNENPEGT